MRAKQYENRGEKSPSPTGLTRISLSSPLLPLSSAPHGEGPGVEELAKGSNSREMDTKAAPCSAKPNPSCRQIIYLHRANKEAFLGAKRLWSGSGHEEEDGTSGSSTMESKILGEGVSPIKKKKCT